MNSPQSGFSVLQRPKVGIDFEPLGLQASQNLGLKCGIGERLRLQGRRTVHVSLTPLVLPVCISKLVRVSKRSEEHRRSRERQWRDWADSHEGILTPPQNALRVL